MLMATVTKRELNQNTAAVLEQVTASDDTVVTEWGKPRWRITAYRPQDSPLARLEREGRYTPPAVSAQPWPSEASGPAYTTAELDALLDEIKGDH